ncbi:MAG TPA: hypothetical protein GXZ74_02995 [Tissierellia bacterium]|nr:hypothetical protein [Tissierellia bacterium]
MELTPQDHTEIGFEWLMHRLETITPYGTDRAREQTPYRPDQAPELEAELSAVEFFHQLDPIKLRRISGALTAFKDIRRSLERLGHGGVFDEVEFYEIKFFCYHTEVLRAIVSELKNPRLQLIPTDEIFEILDPQANKRLTFHFYNEYDERLEGLRADKRRLDRLYYQDAGNLVAMNERGKVIAQLDDVTWEVRQTLSRRLRPFVQRLKENIATVARIDHWLAKAQLAKQYGGVRPSLQPTVLARGMRNPWIEAVLRDKHRSLQPIDIALDKGCTVLTGANMGGKSVSLKTLLLNVELFRHGYYVYAKELCCPLFSYVSYQAQDQASLEQGLSSFGREVVMMRDIMTRRQEPGLIVLDEPARGTNPSEASAIVTALCQSYREANSMLLIVTHFPGVARAANRHFQMSGLRLDTDTIRDWSETESEEALAYLERQMDYRLVEVSADQAVPHEGIRVMQFLGMPESFIDTIKQYLGEENDET